MEIRLLPSTVIDTVNRNYPDYLPLNGDTSYDIYGTIETEPGKFLPGTYAYYALPGSVITIQATASCAFDFGYQTLPNQEDFGFDQESENLGGTQANNSFTVLNPGIYEMTIFEDAELGGFGSGNFHISISGSYLGSITYSNFPSNNDYFLSNNGSGGAPQMPPVNAALFGIVPDPDSQLTITWNTAIDYEAEDFPSVPGVRGTGADEFTIYDSHTFSGTAYFTPDFMYQGQQPIRGGRLILSASATIFNVPLQFTSGTIGGPANPPNQLYVLVPIHPGPKLINI